jgi:hypothetical protein
MCARDPGFPCVRHDFYVNSHWSTRAHISLDPKYREWHPITQLCEKIEEWNRDLDETRSNYHVGNDTLLLPHIAPFNINT